MSGVGNINRLIPGLVEKLDITKSESKGAVDKGEGNFSEVFSSMINSVNDLQKESAQIQTNFMNGEPVEIHQMMIKAQEAGVAMDLLLEIRNKLINAYSEIMRMPI